MEKPLSTPMIAFDYCEVIALAPSRDMLSRLAETAGLPVDTLVARYWQYRPEYDVGLPAADYWSRVMGTGSTTFGRRKAGATHPCRHRLLEDH